MQSASEYQAALLEEWGEIVGILSRPDAIQRWVAQCLLYENTMQESRTTARLTATTQPQY